MSENDQMKSSPKPRCILCHSSGQIRYEGIRDRLFSVQGRWNIRQCSNSTCGLLWLDPMPDVKDIAKAYVSYYTHDGSGRSKSWLNRLKDMAVEGYVDFVYHYPAKNRGAFKKILGLLLFLHPGHKVDADYSVMWCDNSMRGRLLEVGCGGGAMLKRLQDLGWEVQGVDFDPKAVEAAAKRGVKVHLGSLEQQSFHAESFDIVIMGHVIEHVHEPCELLKTIFNILKRGGKLIFITPNSNSYLHKKYNNNWKPLEPPRHLHIFNTNNIANLVGSVGYSSVVTKTIVRDANGIFIGSHNLNLYDKYILGEKQPVMLRIFARCVQIYEYILNAFTGKYGEEILLIAKK